jgi:4-amino-4-deoxy-L-arabinose transferase-like glycosyltransferase
LIAKIPLLDKTEARYAEIARIMWDTNKWIMPQIDYGIPFGQNHRYQLGSQP